VLLEEAVVKDLCECERCQTAFKRVTLMVHAVENLSSEDKALHNNLEGNINEEESSEEEKKD